MPSYIHTSKRGTLWCPVHDTSASGHGSKQVTKSFLGIFLDQVDHTLNVRQFGSGIERWMSYIWHYRLSICAYHIPEWHFCTFMFVYSDFWVIHIWDVLKRGCGIFISSFSTSRASCSLFSWMISLVTRTAVSVVICFGPRRRPANPFFLNSEVLSYIGQFELM